MSEYWNDIKSDDADFDDEPVYANSEEVRQSVVDQQKYWVSLMFFIMNTQKISPSKSRSNLKILKIVSIHV